MEGELLQLNQRRALGLIGSPDAQPAPGGPQPPARFVAPMHRNMELVELHARVKALRQPVDNARAQIRFHMASQHRQHDCENSQERQR